MRANKTQKGFTIVETLIVLAVTGALFVSTAILIAGQVSRATFRESTTNMEQLLADAMNDVGAGYLDEAPTGVPGCSLQAGQPGSSNCIYVGKFYRVDSGANKLFSEALYAGSNDNPFSCSGCVSQLSTLQKDLPSGIDYNNDASFYVLFERYSDRNNPIVNSGEAQSVGIYEGSPGSFTKAGSGGVVICGDNGSFDVKYTLGVDGSPTVSKEFTSMGCP